MTKSHPLVAIIDSGIGGLSILWETAERYPQVRFDFVSDKKNYPYGTKTEEEVIVAISLTVQGYLKEHQPDVIVIACNTASTVALEELRRRFEVEFVGVVPAIKPAAKLSRTKNIALLATPGTISRAYTDELIKEHAQGCKFEKIGSSMLVTMAEDKIHGKSILLEPLEEVLLDVLENRLVDTVVLGCTHFPLLLDELMIMSPRKVNWIDSSRAISERVGSLLGIEEVITPIKHEDREDQTFYTTGPEIVMANMTFKHLSI